MYVEPASAQAIALNREGGAPCFAAARPVRPRCASNHGCAQECMTSNRRKLSKAATAQREQRAGRQCSANGPGTRHICAVRVALCRVTYHERAAGDARSGGRCKGAAGDAKGRQAMHGVADDSWSGGRFMERRAMHGAVGDARRRWATHGVADNARAAADGAWERRRCTERRAMYGAVGDSKKRRTVQRSGGRCIVSVGQYTEMVYDARSGGRCMERRAMHGAAGDAWSGGRCKGSSRQCTEPMYDAQRRWPCASPARRQMRGKPRQTARRRY